MDLALNAFWKCSTRYRNYPKMFTRVDTKNWTFYDHTFSPLPASSGQYWITQKPEDLTLMPFMKKGLHFLCTKYDQQYQPDVKCFMIIDLKVITYSDIWLMNVKDQIKYLTRWQEQALENLKDKQMELLQQLHSHCELWNIPVDLLSLMVNYMIGVTSLDTQT